MRLTKLFLFITSSVSLGQLSVTSSAGSAAITDALLGPRMDTFGDPVLISSPVSAGTFTNGNTAFTNGSGFNSGIILSSGDINDAVGTNDSSGTSTNLDIFGVDDTGAAIPDGSAVLDAIFSDKGQSFTTNDATSLTFQFETTSVSDLNFNYIFASEEYNEFVGSSFNDVFAFVLTLDGNPTNFTHDTGESYNLAVLPDSPSNTTPGSTSGIITDGTEVAINTVNNDSNSESYIDNDAHAETPPSSLEAHEYDGRTTSLTASFTALPAGIHQISLLVADAGDSILDSSVFLEQDTFYIIPNSPIPAALDFLLDANSRSLFHDFNSRLLRSRAAYEELGRKNPIGNYGSNQGGYGNSHFIDDNRFKFMGSYNSFNTEIPAFTGSTVYIPSYELSLMGGTIGAEMDVSQNFKLGLGFSHNSGDFDIGEYESAEVSNNGFGVYASYFTPISDNVFFHADGMYGYLMGNVDTTRDFEEFGNTTGSGDLSGHYLELNMGVDFHLDTVTHGPIASLKGVSQTLDSFTESGFAAQTYPEITHDTMKLRGGYQLNVHNHTTIGTLTLQGRLSYESEISGDDRVVDGVTLNPDDSAVVGGVGALWNFQTGGFIGLDYEGAYGDSLNTHNFYARASFSF